MAIGSEAFGRCVVKINVSIEVENRDIWLCYGMSYLRFILAGKAAQAGLRRWVVVPGIGNLLRLGLSMVRQ
jgi:hypothetical protein